MEHRIGKMGWHAVLPVCLLALSGAAGGLVFAQEKITTKPTTVHATPSLPASGTELPATPPAGPLTLDECIAIGYENQPSLSAAHASLAAAPQRTGQSQSTCPESRISSRAIPPVRRQQACLGVTIAGAGVLQAEWETRYAITRNFFTVQYVRTQQIVVEDALKNLTKGRDKADKLFKIGSVDYPVSKLDIQIIEIRIELVKSSKAEVDNGMLKALAAAA